MPQLSPDDFTPEELVEFAIGMTRRMAGWDLPVTEGPAREADIWVRLNRFRRIVRLYEAALAAWKSGE